MGKRGLMDKIGKIIGVFVFMMTIVLTQRVSADIGPKPSVTVFVKNFESKDYYLDLLVKEDGSYMKYDMFNENYPVEYKELNLYKYNRDGWIAEHIRNWLLFGSLKGEYDSLKDVMVHRFTYHGVPDTFKVIIQYKSGEMAVSNVISPRQFNAQVIYDLKTGEVYKVPRVLQGVGYFLVLMLATVLIELIIALFFKIKPLKVVGIVNISTQLLLHISMLVTFYLFPGKSLSYVFYIMEFLILFLEYFLYEKYAQYQGRKRLIYYVLIANILTFLIGLHYA